MVFGAGVIFVFFRWSKYRVVRNPPTTNPNQQLSSLWIKAIFMPCQWLQHSGWGEGRSEGFVGHAMICTNMPRCWRILDFVEQGKLILHIIAVVTFLMCGIGMPCLCLWLVTAWNNKLHLSKSRETLDVGESEKLYYHTFEEKTVQCINTHCWWKL